MIIGLTGFAQSGKDTLANMLVKDHGFKRVAFADKMKDILLILNPYVRYVNDHGAVHFLRVKEAVDLWGWENAKKFTEVREMLQRLGTEGGRELISEDVWIRAAFKGISITDTRVVFTDVRFPNEAEEIQKVGGKIIRIVRGNSPINSHTSETAYTNQDYTIVNNGEPLEMLNRFLEILNDGH